MSISIVKNWEIPGTFENGIMVKLEGVSSSVANALRRTLVNDIDVYTLDMEKMTVHVNTSSMPLEYIGTRLELIPIKQSALKKYSADDLEKNVKIDFDIQNDSSISPLLIHGSDIDKNGKLMDPNFLFYQLNPKQRVHITIGFSHGTGEIHAKYCSVVAPQYTLITDSSKEKDSEHVPGPVPNGTLKGTSHVPGDEYYGTYLISVENIGMFEKSEEILRIAIEQIIRRLVNFKAAMDFIEVTNSIVAGNTKIAHNTVSKIEKIVFKEYEQYFITGETSTLGQLIAQDIFINYLSSDPKNKDLLFGFNAGHPLDNKIFFKTTIPDSEKVMVESTERLINLFESFLLLIK